MNESNYTGVYRKKPVEITAVFYDGSTESIAALNTEFLGSDLKRFFCLREDKTIDIVTLEGTMKAFIGDYIIRGVNGEFYPCKPDIFKKTYDKVE